MFSFYRIPKLLFTDETFRELSTDAKVLYGIMLDRMSLSSKNQWYDAERRIFIYFTINDVMEYLNCKKNKAIEIMKELDSEGGIGLIEKSRQGQGKPTMIYVKNFMPDSVQKLEKQTSGIKMPVSEVGKTNFLGLEKQTSRSLENKPLEVGKTNPNNTKYNNTEYRETESNLILSEQAADEGVDKVGTMDRIDKMYLYAEQIQENIALDILLQDYPNDTELIQGMYELILETVLDERNSFAIAGGVFPGELVRSKFMKLDSTHVTYVVGCFKSNTTKVRNIKKYLLTALFNAPSTISGYYQAEVNHDMPQFAPKRAIQ